MKKIIFILLLLAVNIFCFGREPVSFITNENYFYDPEKYVSLIDPEIVNTGVLIDKVLTDQKILNINGYDKVKTIYSGDWYNIYNALKKASYDKTGFMDTDLIERIRKNYYHPDLIRPISIIDFEFNRIKEEYLHNGVFIETDSILIVNDADTSAFTTHRAIAASCLTYNVFGDDIKFILPENLFFTNITGEELKSIEIDFGNGQGYRHVEFDEIITVSYPTVSDYFEVKIRITHQDINTEEENIYYSHFYFFKMRGDYPPHYHNKNNSYFPSEYDTPDKERGIEYHILFNENNESGKLRRPFIVCDGFDPGNMRTYYETSYKHTPPEKNNDKRGLYARFNGDQSHWETELSANLIPALQSYGYDIVILDFHWGAGPIQKNAATLRDFINQIINSEYRDNKTEEIIFVGPSMGGLISRWAFRTMAQNNEEHYVKTWISFDSPQKGAYIPIGLQWFLKHFEEDHQAAEDGITQLNTYAARQMLLYHYTNPTKDIKCSDPFEPGPYYKEGAGLENFSEFYAQLEDLDYPLFSKNYAISSGGKDKLYSGYPDGHKQIIDFETDYWIPGITPEAKAWGSRSSTWATKIYEGKRIFTERRKHIKGKLHANGASQNTLAYDNAPGGYNTALYSINFSDDNNISLNDNITWYTKATFMVTSSAFGIDIDWFTLNNTHEDYTNRNDLTSGKIRTPFDEIHGMENNEEHCNISKATRDYVIHEFKEDFKNTIRPRERLTYEEDPVHQTINQTVSGEVAYMAKETIAFGGDNNDNTFTVKAGADVNIRAGEQITFLPGFSAEKGATLHASIDPDIDYGSIMRKTPPETPLVYNTINPYRGIVHDYSSNEETGRDHAIMQEPVESQEDFSLALFPNPALNKINVEVTGITEGYASIKVYNSMGYIVYQSRIYSDGIYTIDISGFEQGIYYLKAIYDSDVISSKFVKL